MVDLAAIFTILVLIGMAVAVYCGYLSTGKVAAIAPLLLAAITIAYVYLTQKLVQETRRSRRERVKPALELEPVREGLKVVNRGLGPATDVIATFSLTDDPDSPYEIDIGSLNPDSDTLITHPVSAVVGEDAHLHDKHDELTVTLAWNDVLGNSDSESITCDTEAFISDDSTEDTPLEAIESHLEDIHTELRLIRDSQFESDETPSDENSS